MPANTLCPLNIPIELPCGVQRVSLAGGVVIHHVLASELGRDVGVRPYQRVSRAKTSGSWRRTHSNFGPTAWLDSNVPACSRIASAPKFLCQHFDLGRCAGVHAVQDGGTQGPQGLVA
jgi:hypothetical protein